MSQSRLEYNDVLQSLLETGWFVSDRLFSIEHCQQLASQFNIKTAQAAKIGRGPAAVLAEDIRTDFTEWLSPTPSTQAQDAYLTIAHDLMFFLKNELRISLNYYESHFAVYQSGGFYRKHLDNFRNQNSRILSFILYLSSDDFGGELVIYKEANPTFIETKIRPKVGRAVIFYSSRFFHEVLPTTSERISLTGWMGYDPYHCTGHTPRILN